MKNRTWPRYFKKVTLQKLQKNEKRNARRRAIKIFNPELHTETSFEYYTVFKFKIIINITKISTIEVSVKCRVSVTRINI